MATKLLRVLPNPYQAHHIYADGVPRFCSAVHVDMVEHVPQPGRYVGASIERAELVKPAKTQQIGRHTVQHAAAVHDLYWKFAEEPVSIPNTGYYRDAIKARSLIAADEPTAKAAGVPFAKPEAALAEERAKGIAFYESYYGPGSFAEAQPKPEPAPEAPPTETRAASKRSAKD